jgi:hypothetical protein
MEDGEDQGRYFAPNVTDADTFRGMVEAHPYFMQGYHKFSAGRQIIANRLGWLQQAMTYGQGAVEGSDIQFMTDDQLMTEAAILEDIRNHGELGTE